MATSPIDPTGGPWAQRHPQLAQQERAFRRQRRTIRKEFGKVTYGTPETRYHAGRVQQGALARLYTAGALTLEQLTASQEIAAVHERITRDVTIGTMSMETRVDQSCSGPAQFFEQLGAVRREVAYGRWREALAQRTDDGRPPAAGPVLAMIVEDLAVSTAARRWHMRTATAKKLLNDALDLWPAMLDDAFRDVREADLLAAQAGIL